MPPMRRLGRRPFPSRQHQPQARFPSSGVAHQNNLRIAVAHGVGHRGLVERGLVETPDVDGVRRSIQVDQSRSPELRCTARRRSRASGRNRRPVLEPPDTERTIKRLGYQESPASAWSDEPHLVGVTFEGAADEAVETVGSDDLVTRTRQLKGVRLRYNRSIYYY